MGILVKNLPSEIFNLYSARCRDQGNTAEVNGFVSNYDIYEKKGFQWEDSFEGSEFWNNINEENYTCFYEKYGTKIITSENFRDNIHVYHGKIKGRNVKITIEYE